MARNAASPNEPGVTPSMSKRRRVVELTLSPEHLRSARSLPSSYASNQNSPFLTPPIPSEKSMSPPPRPEEDSYLSVHSHKRGMKKQHRQHARKHYTSRAEAEILNPNQHSLTSGNHTEGSSRSKCESCGTLSGEGDQDTPSHAISAGRAISETQWHEDQEVMNTRRGSLLVRTRSLKSTAVTDTTGPESPAVNALRRLSQSPAAGTVRTIGPMRRMSQAMVASFRELVSMTPDQGANESHWPPAPKRSNTFSVVRPVTITLRKASNPRAQSPRLARKSSIVRSNTIAAGSSLREGKPSELIAFYSTKISETTPQSLDLTSSENSKVAGRPKDGLSIFPSKKRSRSIIQYGDQTNTRRHSLLADTTLTFADVHLGSGTFAVDPKSSKTSQDSSRRISVVQFRSRDSVHEIIWREDETTSGSSSQSTLSPHLQDSGAVTPGLETRGTTKQVPVSIPQEFRSFDLQPFSSSDNKKSTRNLFHWSWEKPSVPASDGPNTATQTLGYPTFEALTDPLLAPHSHKSSPDFTRTSSAMDPTVGKMFPRRSLSERPSVMSFPPLRDRNSTSDWYTASLVDLNDPLAGRVPQSRLHEDPHNPLVSLAQEHEEHESKRIEGQSRRPSGRPYALARAGEQGTAGSSIGISSHRRVPSRDY